MLTSIARSAGQQATRVCRRAVLFAGLLPLTSLLFLGCGLIGGGPSQEEFDLLTQELATTELELGTAFGQVAAEKANAANARTELGNLRQVMEEDQLIAAEQSTEGLISLERARLDAVMFAQRNLDAYSAPYRDQPLVWEVESASEDEEFYYINLTYRPFVGFEGTPGREEFIMDKTGRIEFRQVLDQPIPNPTPTPAPPPAEGGG